MTCPNRNKAWMGILCDTGATPFNEFTGVAVGAPSPRLWISVMRPFGPAGPPIGNGIVLVGPNSRAPLTPMIYEAA